MHCHDDGAHLIHAKRNSIVRTRERMETAQPMYVIMEKAKAVSGGYRGRGGGGGGRKEQRGGKKERGR